MIKMIDFTPKPIPSYPVTDNLCQKCGCCHDDDDYLNFLIGEYGADKVLRVEREREKAKARMKEIVEDNPILFLSMVISLLSTIPEFQTKINEEIFTNLSDLIYEVNHGNNLIRRSTDGD